MTSLGIMRRTRILLADMPWNGFPLVWTTWATTWAIRNAIRNVNNVNSTGRCFGLKILWEH